MMLRQFVKCWIYYFYIVTLYWFLNIGYFLRSFIYKKYNKVHFFIIGGNWFGYLLKQCGLTCLRLGNNHSSLSLSYWWNQINNPHSRTTWRYFHMKTFIRKYRCKLLKRRSSHHLGNGITVDWFYIKKSTELFSLVLNLLITYNNVTCLKSESFNLSRWHIYVIFSRKIIGTSYKSITFRKYLKYSVSFRWSVHKFGIIFLFHSIIACTGLNCMLIASVIPVISWLILRKCKQCFNKFCLLHRAGPLNILIFSNFPQCCKW